MECHDVRERLLELVYNEPGDGDPGELLRHIEQCGECAAELEGLRRTRESLSTWTAPAHVATSASLSGGMGSRPRATLRGALLGAAATIVLCVGAVGVFGNVHRSVDGLTVSVPVAAVAATPSLSQDFLLLLLSQGANLPADSAEERRLVSEYGDWAGQLGRDGKLVSAEKLGSDDAIVLRREGEEVRANPLDFRIAQAHVAGFFQVRAGSFAEAQAIARECPHLKYGGGVEIRRIEKTR